MRLIINVTECRNANGKRGVVAKLGYMINGNDGVRVQNCGMELYNLIVDGFKSAIDDGLVIVEGERR